jgi:valacyclovir hydrolase
MRGGQWHSTGRCNGARQRYASSLMAVSGRWIMSWFENGENRIYYTDEGSGDAVLMLPGWAGSIDELSPLGATLTSKYRVIAADLPGSGKSEPQPRQYTPTYYHDDARSFLAFLDHVGAAPAHIVGFSDGGEVAFVMAELQSAAVRSIVAWGSAGRIEAPPEMFDAMENVVDAPIEPLKEFSDYLKSAYGEANGRAMAASLSSAMRAISAAGGDVSRARAGEIACAALLIAGEHDFICPPSLVSAMAKDIPRGEFMEVKGADHGVHHSHPDWLSKTVVDWLEKH